MVHLKFLGVRLILGVPASINFSKAVDYGDIREWGYLQGSRVMCTKTRIMSPALVTIAKTWNVTLDISMEANAFPSLAFCIPLVPN